MWKTYGGSLSGGLRHLLNVIRWRHKLESGQHQDELDEEQSLSRGNDERKATRKKMYSHDDRERLFCIRTQASDQSSPRF